MKKQNAFRYAPIIAALLLLAAIVIIFIQFNRSDYDADLYGSGLSRQQVYNAISEIDKDHFAMFSFERTKRDTILLNYVTKIIEELNKKPNNRFTFYIAENYVVVFRNHDDFIFTPRK